MRRQTQLVGIDLFAGAGGMSLGAHLAGVAVEFAVELDPFAARTYSRNHPTTELYSGDIRQVGKKRLSGWRGKGDHLIVFGGPPCQGFSWSNRKTRSPANPDNWLFREFVRVVALLRPAWVVFENVQGIANTSEGLFVSELSHELEQLDYCLSSTTLNASDYGVPQDRTRFFLVASRNGLQLQFPRASRIARRTVDDAIRDLPPLANGNSQCWQRYGRARPSRYGHMLRGSLIGCCNHVVTRNSSFVVKRYAHVPPGGNWEDIPARLMTNYTDRARCHTGIYHRLRADMPSIVIGNYRKNMLIHPTQDRGLSVREAARIQSFPDDYTFLGSIGFQQQQVGNAVPPLLAKRVFESIVKKHSLG